MASLIISFIITLVGFILLLNIWKASKSPFECGDLRPGKVAGWLSVITGIYLMLMSAGMEFCLVYFLFGLVLIPLIITIITPQRTKSLPPLKKQ